MNISQRSKLKEKISDWSALTKRQALFDATKHEWVFRGQKDDRWDLQTSIERTADDFRLRKDRVPGLEIGLILEFIRRYHLYAAERPPRPGDTLDWLALMRHHGAPTRLLDFTFNFLVAAYFALEDQPNGNPVVWAINKSWLSDLVWDWAHLPAIDMAPTMRRLAVLRDGQAFRELLLERSPLLVCPVSPFRLNQRLTVQQGVFLCPGNVQRPFQSILKALDGYDRNVIRVSIARTARLKLLGHLERSGLNRASLFPGLDGFAQSLRTRVLLLNRLKDMEQAGARRRENIGLATLEHW